MDGDVLELTFFSPEMSYNGQYKVNGKAVDLNTEYISKSDYMQQKAGSNSVQFHTGNRNRKLTVRIVLIYSLLHGHLCCVRSFGMESL